MIGFSNAAPEDYPGIVDVMEDAGYLAFKYPGLPKDEVVKRISADRSHYFLAFDKSLGHKRVIVGYHIIGDVGDALKGTPVRVNPRYAYSYGIGVRTDYRGRNIAVHLKKHVEREAKRFGYQGIYTDVDSANEESLRVQKKAGYTQVARYPDPKRAEQSGINIVFVKKLS